MRALRCVWFVVYAVTLSTCLGWPKGDVVARIGDQPITREMVKARAQYLQALGTSGKNPEVIALAQFTQAYLATAVLQKYNIAVSDSVVTAYWAQLQANWPARVSDVAMRAGDDGFRKRVFAFPDVALQTMDWYFSTLPIHAQRRQQAERLQQILMEKPFLMKRLATLEGFATQEIWLAPNRMRSKTGRTLSSTEAQRQQASDIFFLLADTPPGQVYREILDTPEAYQIFRILTRRPMEVLVAILTIPKPTIDDWFWDQIKSISVAFYDPKLEQSLWAEVPWASRVTARTATPRSLPFAP